MPIYEYVCERCGVKSEILQRLGTDGRHTCPKCNCKKMRKVFSLFAARTAGPSGSGRGNSSGCTSCTASSCASCRR